MPADNPTQTSPVADGPTVDERIEAQVTALDTSVPALQARARELEAQAGPLPTVGPRSDDIPAILAYRRTLHLLQQAQQARESAAAHQLLIRPATEIAALVDQLIRTSGTRRRHLFLHLPLWAHHRLVRLRSTVFEVGTVRVGCQRVKGVAADEISATGRDFSRVFIHRITPGGFTPAQAAIYRELRAGGQPLLDAYDAARS